MDEHRPSARSDDPLHGHTPAVRAQLVAALAAPHAIDRPPAIELRSAFAEPEQQAVIQGESNRAAFRIDAQTLNRATVARRNVDETGHRVGRARGREAHDQIAALDASLRGQRSDTRRGRRPRIFHQRSVSANRLRPSGLEREEADPRGQRADWRDDDLDRPIRDADDGVLRARGLRGDEGARGYTHPLEQPSPRASLACGLTMVTVRSLSRSDAEPASPQIACARPSRASAMPGAETTRRTDCAPWCGAYIANTWKFGVTVKASSRARKSE